MKTQKLIFFIPIIISCAYMYFQLVGFCYVIEHCSIAVTFISMSAFCRCRYDPDGFLTLLSPKSRLLCVYITG